MHANRITNALVFARIDFAVLKNLIFISYGLLSIYKLLYFPMRIGC
jgi:hypothetical protein